ncbi:MAG: two-component system sensor histidine kinase BarA [Phenylobacterium sp.]|jgi:two-component system sensor histidine kinase BarA
MAKSQSFTPTQPSFRNQLVIFTGLGLVIFSLVTSLLIAWLVSGMAQTYMTDNGKQVTHGLAEQSWLAVMTQSNTHGQAALKQVQQFPEVVAAKIILPTGEVLVQHGDFAAVSDAAGLNTITESLLFYENDSFWVFSAPIFDTSEEEDDDDDAFELGEDESEDGFTTDLNQDDVEDSTDGADVTAEQKIIGYSMVKMSKDTLSQANQLIVTYALAVGAVAVLVFTILTNYGVSKLTQPLLNLAQVMLDAEKTGEHLRADVEGPKEVQRMAHAYNSMMQVLDTQDEELRLHRDQLEAEVDIRTRELTEARDTALTANRHKSEFLANMTHELRTPIQAIIGYVDLVQEELEIEGLTELNEDLDKVNNNSNRLLSLINSVLDFAKVEAGKMDVNTEKVSARIIALNVKETVLPLMTKNQNSMVVSGSDLTHELNVDREKLEQVLINLLTNAAKFTKAGTVTFDIAMTEKAVVFSVIDTGIGIEPSYVETIFDEFQQVDGTQSRQFQGTGLGLAICKRFCELIRAEIGVTSTLGEGSTFFVRVPLNDEDDFSTKADGKDA